VKRCNQCERELDTSEFYRDTETKCKVCKIAANLVDQFKRRNPGMEIDPIIKIRKGICLVLWRLGRGKIGESVKLHISDLTWQLGAIGIKTADQTTQAAVVANTKSSWIEREVLSSTSGKETCKFKLTQMCGQRAAEAASELGTELLPKVPAKMTEPEIDYEAVTVIQPETTKEDTTDQFIENMLNVLTRASDASRLQRELDEAKSNGINSPETIAILKDVRVILCLVANMEASPIGQLLNEANKGRELPLTTEAGKLSDAVARMIKG